VKYVPDLCVNLISIPTALQNGFQIGNKGNHLYLKKGNFQLYFDKLFKTRKSYVCGIELYPMIPNFASVAIADGNGPTIKSEIAHKRLGHCREDAIRKTAKYYNWHLSSLLNACAFCGIGKARQAPLNKITIPRSKIPEEHLFVDLTSVKGESLGGNKY